MRAARLALLALTVALAAGGCTCGAKTHPPSAARAGDLDGGSAPIVPRPGSGFLKGQLHAHTSRSQDSKTSPEDVAAYYASRGFDFLVFTDHDRVTRAEGPPEILTIPGVEITQNLDACDPPPPPGDGCLLHVNALFVTTSAKSTRMGRPTDLRRDAIFGRAFDRAVALGALPQLNHPNFQAAADIDVIMALARRGPFLMEIANQAVDSANDATPQRPSTEELWDAALSRGAHIFGTATDDAHQYGDADEVRARGEIAYTGDRGYVMVRAEKRVESIRAAIVAGAFYSSTGVVLDRVDMGDDAIAIDVGRGEEATFEVIGDGRVIAQRRGTELRFDPRGAGLSYVRVRILGPEGRRAWTQPVWLTHADGGGQTSGGR